MILSSHGIIGSSILQYDADALAYITAVETADTQTLETAVKIAINKFVVNCKADGIWNAIRASAIMAGARTLNGALVPLKGTAPTNFNFVSGDYNRKTGLIGNGTTKYLDSNRNNNADPQNSHHLAIWMTVADTGTTTNPSFIGTGGGGDTGESVIGYALSAVPNQYFFRSRMGASAAFAPPSPRGIGLHAVSRTSDTNVSIRLPGYSANQTITSVAPRNVNIRVFARDILPYSNGRASFYSIGESIDLALLDTRVDQLMTDLNNAIP